MERNCLIVRKGPACSPAALCLLLLTVTLPAQSRDLPGGKDQVIASVDRNEATLKDLNQRIWSYAELGLQEVQSSAALQDFLKTNGFAVQAGIAAMPTAFVASYGEGRPVIGILAEFDALPGLSQKAVPTRTPREGVNAGHGCGHSVFGTASSGAAVAIKEYLEQSRRPGTIRLYGTPAEETGIGKTFILREGFFDDADVILSWHAEDRTSASFHYTKALLSAKFRFKGLPAHASVSPHEGLSALDGVELMNVGANYFREHAKEDTRIHYVVTRGGDQPNVVPPEAEVWYYLRANKHYDVEKYFERLQQIAQGAALMSGTTFEMEVLTDHHEVLPNLPLSQLIQQNLELVGAPRFSDGEKAFARATQQGMEPLPEQALSEVIDALPAEPGQHPASTDIGDVSWQVPVGRLRVATYSYGAPGHSWQVVACTGMSIGEKGMQVAAKALAASAVDLYEDPKWIAEAHEDFDKRRTSYPFKSFLPDDARAPQTGR